MAETDDLKETAKTALADAGIDKDLEMRRNFAEYFTRVSPSEDARDRWESYRTWVARQLQAANEKEREIALLRETKSKLNEEIASLEDSKARVSKAQEYDQVQSTLMIRQQELNSMSMYQPWTLTIT